MGQWNHALQAYKMVLFLNPNDDRTASIVQKLEKDIFFSTEGKESGEEFSMKKTGPRCQHKK
jgi:hypothetical protein